MTTQISPQMKIVALAGVLLIALAGGALVFLHHSKSGPEVIVSTHHPAASSSHRTTPPPVLEVVAPAVDPQLPAPLRAQLERHPVVVAGFWDPQVATDGPAMVEARAGAAAAHAGFLRVDLLDDRVAGVLTALLPSGQLLPTPGILVYNRAGKVVYRFDGYLDRAAIAQAVADAK